ncbi:PfkB family carbohydrate kinase [uncultured Rhodoblastus sp.]|uniref:PfkB family carbohydrate kinase n=1 Tax=uncultured Rhodoblastus sp. TaxID=543037 RepID=UPI0025D7FE92|nr:PfkB family carbohydrate kinase [uncultured Rhodoblastus sp.]
MFLVCGEALFDLIAVTQESEHGEKQFAAFPGGSPLNLAIGLRRLGESVAFVGGLSSDGFGADLRSMLELENIDFSRARTTNLPTPVALASTRKDGQVAYSFYVKGCAHLDFDVQRLVSAREDGFESVALGSFLLDDEAIGDALVQGIKRISKDLVVSFDPNVRPGVISNRKQWLNRFQEISESSTIIKASDEDVFAVWGAERTAREQAEIWLDRGCALVVITSGSEGARIFHASGVFFVPALATPFVDAIGAGDAFHAAFLAGLSRRKLVGAESIRRLESDALIGIGQEAAAAAAITCSRPGANPPTYAELLEKINGFKNG